nr:MAG TPA: hypothetical protein [Caudoviricetes sp.]
MIPYIKPPLFLNNIFLALHLRMCYNTIQEKIIKKCYPYSKRLAQVDYISKIRK